MLVEVAEWLVNSWIKVWNLFLNGGYIGMFVILIPVLRKLVRVMKQFVN